MVQNRHQNHPKSSSGVVWGGSWSLSGLLGRVLEHLGGVSGRLGRLRGVLGGVFGRPGVVLEGLQAPPRAC